MGFGLAVAGVPNLEIGGDSALTAITTVAETFCGPCLGAFFKRLMEFTVVRSGETDEEFGVRLGTLSLLLSFIPFLRTYFPFFYYPPLPLSVGGLSYLRPQTPLYHNNYY